MLQDASGSAAGHTLERRLTMPIDEFDLTLAKNAQLHGQPRPPLKVRRKCVAAHVGHVHAAPSPLNPLRSSLAPTSLHPPAQWMGRGGVSRCCGVSLSIARLGSDVRGWARRRARVGAGRGVCRVLYVGSAAWTRNALLCAIWHVAIWHVASGMLPSGMLPSGLSRRGRARTASRKSARSCSGRSLTATTSTN